jgi:hypothetical protein
MENAPEITACDATADAAVASTTSRIAHDQRALPEIIQEQRRQRDRKPGKLDRFLAEVPHIRVERLTAGDHQEHAAQRDEPGEPVAQKE